MRKESNARSVAKSATWRVLGTLTTMTISLLVTGDVGTAFKIGPVDFVCKFVVFYAHERAWLLPAAQRLPASLKLVTWKIIANIMTASTAALVTGDWAFALKLGPADFLAKTLLLAFHEWVWEFVAWGRERVGDDKDEGKKAK